MKKQTPKHYIRMKEQYPEFMEAVENLGKAVRKAGPLDEVQAQLVQLAGAVAIQSEGAVHSHVRRAANAGATSDQIEHTILLLTSTIGFPAVMAALSWARDVLED